MKIILLILSLFIISLSGNEQLLNIDNQIIAIQTAPKSQRVALMNTFKQKLFQLNQTQRLVIIKKLMKSNNIISKPINNKINSPINNIESVKISQIATQLNSKIKPIAISIKQIETNYKTTTLYDCNQKIK